MMVPITPTTDEQMIAASNGAVWNASPEFWINPRFYKDGAMSIATERRLLGGDRSADSTKFILLHSIQQTG